MKTLQEWEKEEIIKLAQTKYRVHTCEFDNRPELSNRVIKQIKVLRREIIKRQDEFIVNFVSRHEGCTPSGFEGAWGFYQSNMGLGGTISSRSAVLWAIHLAKEKNSPLVFVRGGENWKEEDGWCFGTRAVFCGRPENILSYENNTKL